MKKESALKRNPPSLDWAEELTDEQLFQRAMEEVRPLPRRDRKLPSRPTARPAVVSDDWIHPTRELLEWLDGEEGDDGRRLSGGPYKRDPLLMKKLKAGGFSVQAELDLHGLSRGEARLEVDHFVRECRRRGLRCVRLIHGKGNHSKGEPVLRRLIPKWLEQRKLAKHLVAYTTARPIDGGEGALYLLLCSGDSAGVRRRG